MTVFSYFFLYMRSNIEGKISISLKKSCVFLLKSGSGIVTDIVRYH